MGLILCARLAARKASKNLRTQVPHKDKETKAQYNRDYYQRNGDTIRAQVKEYRVSDPKRYRTRQSQWYAGNKDRVYDTNSKNHLFRAYGITTEDYNKMLESQGSLCAICRRPEPVANRKLSVDHCHKTGKVRALLCGPCNKGLGIFEKNKDQFEIYLIKYSAKP